MKKHSSKIIIGIIIFVVGLAIFIVGGLSGGFKDDKWTENEFNATESVNALDIEIDIGTTDVQFYEGDQVLVTYPTSNIYAYSVNVTDGKLTVKPHQNLLAQFSILHFFYFHNVPKVKVCIPNGTVISETIIKLNAGTIHISEGNYGKTSLKVNAGTLSAENLNCETFSAKVNAGTAKINGLVSTVSTVKLNAGTLYLNRIDGKNFSAKVNAGTLNAKMLHAKSEYTISVDKSAGSCNVSSQRGSTEKVINIDLSAGSCNVSFLG